MKRYRLAALGGTFDHLHMGHERFIASALAAAERVIIGVTSDDFPQIKAARDLIKSFRQRRQELEEFIGKQGLSERVELIPLEDRYGPTVSQPGIEAVVVTQQTYDGGREINTKRELVGMGPLPLIKAEMVTDQEGKYLSSTRIRLGEIDREGRLFQALFQERYDLSPSQKEELRKPQGTLFRFPRALDLRLVIAAVRPTKLALVGDVAVGFFLKNGLAFDYGVFDEIIGRKSTALVTGLAGSEAWVVPADNPAGGGTPDLVRALKQVQGHHRGLVKVRGEEDLAVLPLVMLLPLGSLIFYGQPGQGLVALSVSEATKRYYRSWLER